MAFLGTVRHSAVNRCQGLGACHCGWFAAVCPCPTATAVRTLQHTQVTRDFAEPTSSDPFTSRRNARNQPSVARIHCNFQASPCVVLGCLARGPAISLSALSENAKTE